MYSLLLYFLSYFYKFFSIHKIFMLFTYLVITNFAVMNSENQFNYSHCIELKFEYQIFLFLTSFLAFLHKPSKEIVNMQGNKA